ncbi:MAG: OB-fold nucleic acid binding domain-containing protein [Candidatus Bathyarchaeota archaeon]|nr:OB-fold nucleic acid binding domain-containing protein [Candidatus Bathyarchaeota archaeon]
MGIEEIINQILSSRSDLNRQQVMEMIQKKKSEVPNFLTDETAARITASELGVKNVNKTHRFKIQIKDIFSGLNDVTVSGKVVSVYPPKTFKRKDWTEGKLASVIVSDQTGTLRVVLWDNKVDWVEQGRIQRDQTIRFSHGYVREGLDGNPEIHLGDKGRIKILDEQTKKLADITKVGGPITVEGTVATTPQFREVTTAKNEKVFVASFHLSDSSTKIRVSVWRNLAEEVKDLAVGTRLKMKNVYAKKGYENGLELSSRYQTTIDILEQQK